MVVKHGMYLGFNAKPWQTIETESLTQQHPLGAFFDDEYGNRFRYAKNGAGALVAGDIVQSAALGGATTTLQTVAIVGAATPAGNVKIPVAALTTTQAADVFTEGWMAVHDASLVGSYLRRIVAQPAIVHTTWVDAYITIDRALPVALTVSDTLALMANPYKGIIQAVVANATGLVLGGVCGAVTAAYYCWVQTRGWFACHTKEGTLAIGQLSVPKATTAGTLSTHDEDDVNQIVANSPAAWADEAAGIVWLCCE